MAFKVALFAADAGAVLRVVAKKSATVAVAVAMMVAIVCVAASAPVTASTGFLARASESGN
jgi:hypothetical protein